MFGKKYIINIYQHSINLKTAKTNNNNNTYKVGNNTHN